MFCRPFWLKVHRDFEPSLFFSLPEGPWRPPGRVFRVLASVLSGPLAAPLSWPTVASALLGPRSSWDPAGPIGLRCLSLSPAVSLSLFPSIPSPFQPDEGWLAGTLTVTVNPLRGDHPLRLERRLSGAPAKHDTQSSHDVLTFSPGPPARGQPPPSARGCPPSPPALTPCAYAGG